MNERLNKKMFYNLTSYLLFNAYSLKDIGLYQGKTGLSLCLFETAKYLQDESIEEHAVELLQESLVLAEKQNDLTFETGLSGIGFVLLYLIKNQFIDADFEELFGEYTKKIVSALSQKNILTEKTFVHIRFLALLSGLDPKEEVNHFIFKLKQAKEEHLKQQIGSELSKFQFLNDFIDYLQIVFNNRYPVPVSLIHDYAGFYQKEKFASRFEIAFYLRRLTEQKQIENSPLIEKTILDNEKRALQNIEIHPGQFPLAAQIELLYLFHQNPEKYSGYITLLEKDLFLPDLKDLQQNLVRKIPQSKFIPGYQSGIARLLLYFVFRSLKEQGKEAGWFAAVL